MFRPTARVWNGMLVAGLAGLGALLAGGCQSDSTSAHDATRLIYLNSTARTDLRAVVVVGPQTLGTYPLPPDELVDVPARLYGGAKVATTVLDADGGMVSVGSCTILPQPYSYAAVTVTPEVSCGCGFDTGSTEGEVPCNP